MCVLQSVHVLGVSIQTFGVFFALNFLAWGVVSARRLRELGRSGELAYEIVFAAIIGGLVGARGYYLIQNHSELHGGVLHNLFSGSGLIWYGGLIGGVVAVTAWAAWRRVKLSVLADLAAVGLPLGYAIGRIGCQVSGDGDYGTPSGLPWAMPYPHGAVPTDVAVQPTPIYETLVMGLVAFALWKLRDRVRPGVLFASYLVLAGIERFLVEFIRRNADVVAGLTAAQVESLVSLVVGAVWLALLAWRGGLLRRRSVAAPTPAPPRSVAA